jgi:hypothetical protein
MIVGMIVKNMHLIEIAPGYGATLTKKNNIG